MRYINLLTYLLTYLLNRMPKIYGPRPLGKVIYASSRHSIRDLATDQI